MNEQIGLPKLIEQMRTTIIGKTISSLIMSKHKAFNMPNATYEEKLTGQTITQISQNRNWLLVELSNGYSGIHPALKISDLTEVETLQLYNSIRERIEFYQNKIDFFTPENAFDGEGDDFIIAYKDNEEPCPKCSSPIKRFKAGASLSYICENCQRL